MNIALIITAMVVASGIGYFIGKYSNVDIEEMEQATEEMEEFTAKLEAINADNMNDLVEKFSVYIPLLESLENDDAEQAKELLIEELGHFYYNYTYEDERYMNPEQIEAYLKAFEEKAKTSPSFQKIIQYKPEE